MIQLALKSPRSFAYNGASICKALLSAVTHKHSSVSIVGIQALTEAMLVDASGLDQVLDTLWMIVHDKSPSVRAELYKCVSQWQLKLTDRYSYAYKVLPLLLAGCSDELDTLTQFSFEKMWEIGELYEQEWEDRVKPELDLAPITGQHKGEFLSCS